MGCTVLVQTSYFPIAQTQIPWYKPIVNFQEIEHRPPVFQQQAKASQQENNHQCMCLDCVMIRSELDRCANLAFSEIGSDDHFHFVVDNLVTSMHLLRDYQAYIDSEGRVLLLEVVNKVLSWREWLSPDIVQGFESVRRRLGELS